MNRETRVLRHLETALTATPDGLAERFEVGRRSIVNTVARLNECLGSAASIRMEADRYRLYIVDPQRYGRIREQILASDESLNDPSRRQALILRELLAAERPVRTEDLAHSLCVSRSTVGADLAELREVLAGDDVQITGRPNSGLRLEAGELELRMACLTHFAPVLCDDYPLDDEILQVANEWCAANHLNRPTRRTVQRWLTIAVDRYLTGHGLDELPAEFTALAGSRSHSSTAELLERISPLIGTDLPETEHLFMAMAVAGMRTPDDPAGLRLFPADEEIPALVDAIFDRIASIMGIRLDAVELADEFAHHLSFMLNRMRFRISIDEASVRDIRHQYPVAYRMAEISRDVIGERTGLAISDSETGLIAGYHQVFLDSHQARRQTHLRIVIVTAAGRVSAHLMRIQLDRVLPSGTRYLMLSADEVDAEALTGADLVVTTPDVDLSRLPTGSTPVIELDQVFDTSELVGQISRIRFRKQTQLQLAGAGPSLLVSMLDADRFLALPAGTGYWQATEALVDRLEHLGLVDGSFRAALRSREQDSTMLLDRLVGFPHTTIPGAGRVVFAMATIPRRSDEPGARVVFLMGVPDKADYDDTILIDVYDEIIRLTAAPDLLDQLSRLTSHEQVFWFMASHPTTPAH